MNIQYDSGTTSHGDYVQEKKCKYIKRRKKIVINGHKINTNPTSSNNSLKIEIPEHTNKYILKMVLLIYHLNNT